jgi:hypothetical protein
MQPNEFFLTLVRKDTRRDLEQSRFLALGGWKYIDSRHGIGFRTKPEGIIILPIGPLRRKQDADTLWTMRPGWMVVPERVRRIIEPAGMRHVTFRPTILVRGKGRPEDPQVPWEKFGEPWWELSSDLTLPPLSPTVKVVAQDGRPFIGYEKQNLELREGHYMIPELHYLRREIEQCEPFDLGLSSEHLGKPPFQQMKVASQRLYRLFAEHKLKASWTPVRLDE